jgi:penicillin amidase
VKLNLVQRLVRWFWGERLPTHEGTIEVDGCHGVISIRRDDFGIPYIEAAGEEDAWFGLGFCHGQDRAGQLEVLVRILRGTLAEVAGEEGLPIDRLSRRIGFVRAARAQLLHAEPEVQRQLAAYARGVNQGSILGAEQPAHELALLRVPPTAWRSEDVQAFVVFLCFSLASNWDMELMRLQLVSRDGAAAAAALDPAFPADLPVTFPPNAVAGGGLDRLAEELALWQRLVASGGASNVWAVSSSRSSTGRPILASDPHMAPMIPNLWYLASLHCPQFHAVGATFVGVPVLGPGHNGFGAWGVTAAHADNTDLFLEEVGADGASVRHGDAFIPCRVIEEVIDVKGRPSVTERVLVTPRGPIISPALLESPQPGRANAISMAATWLSPRPYTGLLRIHRARSFGECRELFRSGSTSTVCVVWADANDTIGTFLGVELPRRKLGHGLLPLPGWDPRDGWDAEPVPFDELPCVVGPASGFVCTANNQPVPADWRGPYLGSDWLDGYRNATLTRALDARSDWDLDSTSVLQRDLASPIWPELRQRVLATRPRRSDSLAAQELLRPWDGVMGADSVAASVFALFLVELGARVVRARAPGAAAWALGLGATPVLAHSLIGTRRAGHLVRLVREQAAGYVPDWDAAVEESLAAAVATLRRQVGLDPRGWGWGRARPLRLCHPLGRQWPVSALFNLAPLLGAGDATTVAQQAIDWRSPLGSPLSVPMVRAAIDVGAWESCRFALVGGQVGNPFSPHYADQIPLWQSGEGLPLAWSEEAVASRVRRTLVLAPREAAATVSTRPTRSPRRGRRLSD